MPAEADEISYAEDLRYAGETHEWARLEGDVCTVGISDYAQHEIGDVVFVELPEVGETLKAEGDFGVIESVKSAFDVFAPVGGKVVEVNGELESHPELVNEDPYGRGWMVRIRIGDRTDFDALLSTEQYRDAIEGD